MVLDAYLILIGLSVLVISSYLFGIVSRNFRVPTVLLLILCGMLVRKFTGDYDLRLLEERTLLELLGVLGLIFIVLEGSLDLHIHKERYRLISRALLSATILGGLCSFAMALVLTRMFNSDFTVCLLHAIPLTVISSAVAIPSVQHFPEEKKEFVIYESVFSDIMGVLAFNFIAANSLSSIGASAEYVLKFGLTLVVAVATTGVLLLILNYSTSKARFYFISGVLILAYAIAKLYHLPALVLVICFGVILSNPHLIDYPFVRKYLSFERLTGVTQETKDMTSATAFIIRTYFFLLFGYSINLALLADINVIWMGLGLIAVSFILRAVFLLGMVRIRSIPLALIAPRGLISILLYYSIPESKRLPELSEGVLFVVIMITGVAMTIGLMLSKKKAPDWKLME